MISFHHMHLHVCQLTSLHISNVCPLSRNSINLVSSPDQPFQNVPQYPQCTQLDLPSTHYYFRGLKLFGSGYTSGSLSASNLKYSWSCALCSSVSGGNRSSLSFAIFCPNWRAPLRCSVAARCRLSMWSTKTPREKLKYVTCKEEDCMLHHVGKWVMKCT